MSADWHWSKSGSESPPDTGQQEGTYCPDSEISGNWFSGPCVEGHICALPQETEEGFTIGSSSFLINIQRKGGQGLIRVFTRTKGNFWGRLGLFQAETEGELGFPRD